MNLTTRPRLRTLTDSWADRVEPDVQFENTASVNLERVCRGCRLRRQGAAAVEFALVAPLFFLLVMGMIEFGRAIMVQQLITNAAREGVRNAVLDGSTSTSAKAAANQYLTAGGVSGATISVLNSAGAAVEPSTIGYGESVTVRVAIPYSSVSWLPSPWFLGSKTLAATAIMRRETVQ